ncbi:MAG: hypothetical protein U0822_25695 [Anaerolineae bacterium]
MLCRDGVPDVAGGVEQGVDVDLADAGVRHPVRRPHHDALPILLPCIGKAAFVLAALQAARRRRLAALNNERDCRAIRLPIE